MATQVVLAVAWAKKQVGSYAYNKRCQAFVADCFSDGAGMARKSASSAKAACNLWRVSTDKNNIPFGAAVYFDSPTAPAYGHVGLYIGSGQVVHAFGAVKIMSLSAIISAGYTWKGWGWNGGVKPSGAGNAASHPDGDPETDAEPVVVHIPQTERIYTVYDSDNKSKLPDAYRVAWKSVNATRYRNITDRVGNLTLKDDSDSVCVELSFDVLEGFGDYYLGTLPIVCGDTITVTNTASGVCVFFGQVQSLSGSFRGELSVSCLDLGRLLTTNDVILQCNNVAARTALLHLATRLGIKKFSCPNLVSSVYEVYKDNAATIAQGILETVTAENGVPYFLRMMWDTLVVRAFGKTPITAYCRPADNLQSFDVLSAPADLSVGYSIDDLRNHVIVYSDNDNAVSVQGTAENAASIARYGRRTALETFSDKDTVSASSKARKVLAAKNIVAESVSFSCYGSDAVVAGCRLSLSLPEVSGEFWVESVTHDLGTPHRMTLTLRRAT